MSFDPNRPRLTRKERNALIEDLTAKRMAVEPPESAWKRLLRTSASSIAIGVGASVLIGVGGLTGVGLIAIPAFCFLANDGEEARLAKTREQVIKDHHLQEPPRESIFNRLGRLFGDFGRALAARAAADVQKGVWGTDPKGDLTYQWHTHANRVTFTPVVGLAPMLTAVDGPSLKIKLAADGSLTAARYEGAKLQSAGGSYASLMRTDTAGVPMSLAWHNQGEVTHAWNAKSGGLVPHPVVVPVPPAEPAQPSLPGMGR